MHCGLHRHSGKWFSLRSIPPQYLLRTSYAFIADQKRFNHALFDLRWVYDDDNLRYNPFMLHRWHSETAGIQSGWIGPEIDNNDIFFYIFYQSTRIGDAIFRSPWHLCGAKFRKDILIVMASASKPIALTGGKFFVLDYNKMLGVCYTGNIKLLLLRKSFHFQIYKAAFSYFTLLQTIGSNHWKFIVDKLLYFDCNENEK